MIWYLFVLYFNYFCRSQITKIAFEGKMFIVHVTISEVGEIFLLLLKQILFICLFTYTYSDIRLISSHPFYVLVFIVRTGFNVQCIFTVFCVIFCVYLWLSSFYVRVQFIWSRFSGTCGYIGYIFLIQKYSLNDMFFIEHVIC